MATSPALTKQLHVLEEKILHLVSSCAVLKNKLREIDQERDELELIVGKQAEEIKALQKKLAEKNHFHNQDKNSKIVKFTFADNENPSELKEKLDEYIREIDQCITHLSK